MWPLKLESSILRRKDSTLDVTMMMVTIAMVTMMMVTMATT